MHCSSPHHHHKLVLVKLLAEVPKFEEGMPGGMAGFGFGTGNLGNLDNKVSLDRELELLEKDVYLNSEFMPPGHVNLITFFA